MLSAQTAGIALEPKAVASETERLAHGYAIPYRHATIQDYRLHLHDEGWLADD